LRIFRQQCKKGGKKVEEIKVTPKTLACARTRKLRNTH
jgi:hypothetical protein